MDELLVVNQVKTHIIFCKITDSCHVQLSNNKNYKWSIFSNSQEMDIPIPIVQNSLKPNQIIVAYQHYREQMFRCLITSETLQCDVRENFNFLANKRELLKNIKAKKEVILDTNNLALSKALLSDINFSKTNEVFFHPPPKDFDLPFNVLLDHESQYIGLRYKISLLTS